MYKINSFLYCSSVINCLIGITYSFVPLYKLFCAETGKSGQIDLGKQSGRSRIETENKTIKIKFEASKSNDLQWEFIPLQKTVEVKPGETALAFYKAKNISNLDMTGISTYTIIPSRLAPFFNKIQCFCFEKQFLSAREEVEMPVYFFIDEDIFNYYPEITEILISYNFFKAR